MDYKKEFVGEDCPVCGDLMTDDNDNFIPVWNENYDNVTCWWCANHQDLLSDGLFCENCHIKTDRVEGGVCEDCFEKMPMDEWVASW